jgi:Xaa-Pro aminopeptidase
MIKSPAEIAVMQRANDMTIAAYKAGLATLREATRHRSRPECALATSQ